MPFFKNTLAFSGSYPLNRINTELARLLKKKICAEGPLTFRDFMSAALFHETFGFYTRSPDIGSSAGPFDTNAKFPAFAFGIAQAIKQASEVLGDSVRILELGGGTGQLATAIRSFLTRPHEYIILETSSGLRARQTDLGLTTVENLDGLQPAPTVVFGNEVLDALPVHRVMGMGDEKVCELFVALDDDGEFFEEPGDLSSQRLQERLCQEQIHLGRGHIAELCLEMTSFLRAIRQVVEPGYIIFVDYGDTASNLYSYRRRNGTLRSFFQQQQIHDIFYAVGQQDLTADVDFSAVISEAASLGLELSGWISQGTWLTNLDIQNFSEIGTPGSSTQHDIDILTRQTNLGSAFDVLILKTPGLPDGPGLHPKD